MIRHLIAVGIFLVGVGFLVGAGGAITHEDTVEKTGLGAVVVGLFVLVFSVSVAIWTGVL